MSVVFAPSPFFRSTCGKLASLLLVYSRLPLLVLASCVFAQTPPAPGDRGTPADTARPTQRTDQTPPPKAPAEANPDTGVAIPARPVSPAEQELRLRRQRDVGEPSQSPTQFNPDPGADKRPPVTAPAPFFSGDEIKYPAEPGTLPVPADKALPRSPLDRPLLETKNAAGEPVYGLEPVPENLKLPRHGTRENKFIPSSWHAAEVYPLSSDTSLIPANTEATPDRWRGAHFTPWRRYTSGDTDELPYYRTKPALWHHYRQSVLKGDVPLYGQETFLNLTATADALYEDRKITVPSGISAARPGSYDFFGQSRSQVFVTNLALQADFFRGETVFKPVEWLVRVKPVFNFNRVDLRETLVSPDPRGAVSGGIGSPPNNGGVVNPGDIDGLLNPGLATPASLTAGATYRNKTYVALQEAFVEVHLIDLSDNYDFIAVKAGNQTFNSDFRGFIFNDTNLGLRFFGNAANNLWQYNAAVFDLREKDTNSELNTFDHRDQRVVIFNVYRQDFLRKGYTAQLSLHYNDDQGGTHYDTNGGIIRPAPIGTVVPHKVRVGYLGWAGDGHLGRWNLTHALYAAYGRDEFNGIAGQPVDIRGHMAALEVSYDRDWVRYKASVFWASGDGDARDDRATGFDSIVDNTNFVGGPFSYFVRQGFNLAGTAVNVKQRFSLLPDLRTSKTEGQANFVNPGLRMGGVGTDLEVTPKLRAFLNANYFFFDEVDPLKTVLLTNQIARAIGVDLSVGFQWRPLLTDNIIVSLGFGALLPGRGFKDIYRTTQPVVPGYTNAGPQVDRWLFSGVSAINFTY